MMKKIVFSIIFLANFSYIINSSAIGGEVNCYYRKQQKRI